MCTNSRLLQFSVCVILWFDLPPPYTSQKSSLASVSFGLWYSLSCQFISNNISGLWWESHGIFSGTAHLTNEKKLWFSSHTVLWFQTHISTIRVSVFIMIYFLFYITLFWDIKFHSQLLNWRSNLPILWTKVGKYDNGQFPL